jgi:hypothetical protein
MPPPRPFPMPVLSFLIITSYPGIARMSSVIEIRTKPQQTLLNISYISPQFTDRNYWTLFNQSVGLAYISPNLLIVGDLNICVSVKHKISWSNKYKIEHSLFLILLILRWTIVSPPEIVSFVSGPGFSSISFASRTTDHKKRKNFTFREST